MSGAFLRVLNLSIAAGWLVLAVILVRLLLKKAPKRVICLLWALVAVRLICPFSIESALSLVPSAETVSTTHYEARPYIQSGVGVIDDAANGYLGSHYFEGVTVPVAESPANPINILSLVWLLGIAALLLYALVSYLRLKRSVGASVPLRDNILVCDEVKSPFILGIIRPRIYVPSSMSDETLDCVLTHEAAHIRRRDHWWKPLGFLLLAVYWFNPLCWVAFILLCRDIEAACDEAVIRELDRDGRAAYSQALLDCSLPRRGIAACPLAFGEVGVKERVKSVLNYKKPAFWIITVAVLACIAVALCFMTSPNSVDPKDLPPIHLHSYCVSELTYERAGTENSVFERENTPVYAITEDMQLLSKGEYTPENEWTNVGKLTEIKLNKENFDALFSDSEWFPKNETAPYFRRNNLRAWVTVYREDTLYLVLQQKNGEVLLAYGHGGPQSDVEYFQWLYRLAVNIHEDTGIIVTSGENVAHPVVLYSGTPIEEVKEHLNWIDISPDPDSYAPFQLFCDGNELNGIYSVYDAETLEPLDFFTPSGLCPQAYIFQNAQPGKDYIVTMRISSDMYCFGARLPLAVEDPGSGPAGYYVCEREGFGGAFTLTLNENGTFQYYEGFLSSYIGAGTWEQDGDTVILTDRSSDTERLSVFTVDGASLVFDKERSARFIYVDLEDGTRFNRSGPSPIGGADATAYNRTVCCVGWSEDTGIQSRSLNADKLSAGSVRHLPIFRIDSAAELEKFRSMLGKTLSLDGSYDEVPSFNETAARYTEDFFGENSLLPVYVTASSGSFRYDVRSLKLGGGALCVNVEEVNHPEAGTADMAGWLVLVEMKKADIRGVTVFDAIFQG